ncbi:hypothetical protein A2U01_0007621, partial [Trifolium medium]|nr:hypothetical protein [Trifolium medium]
PPKSLLLGIGVMTLGVCPNAEGNLLATSLEQKWKRKLFVKALLVANTCNVLLKCVARISCEEILHKME